MEICTEVLKKCLNVQTRICVVIPCSQSQSQEVREKRWASMAAYGRWLDNMVINALKRLMLDSTLFVE